MNKKVMKTAFAAVCVVAAGISGMKAYNIANESRTDLLLAANVEALSAGESFSSPQQEYDAMHQCEWRAYNEICSYYSVNQTYNRYHYTHQADRSDYMRYYYEGDE